MNRSRMIEWLAMAALLYAACIALRSYDIEPQVQVVLWKLGNVTVASFIGYWVDRACFRSRITCDSPPSHHVRRAMIVAAAMLAVAMGL